MDIETRDRLGMRIEETPLNEGQGHRIQVRDEDRGNTIK